MDLLSPNRRLPCNETTNSISQIRLGGCFSQYVTASNSNPTIWQNSTQVKNYSPPYNTAIPPYQRAAINNSGPDSCIPDNPSCCCDYSSNFCSCCGIPSPSEMVCGANQENVNGYCNSFVTSSITASVSMCLPGFYKNAFAKKAWFGLYSYTSPMNNFMDNFSWCGATCNWLSAQTGSTIFGSTPDQTKYLTLSASGTRTFQNFDTSTMQSAAGFVGSLDRYSGNLYVNTAYSSSDGSSTESGSADYIWGQLGLTLKNHSSLLTDYTYQITSDLVVSQDSGAPGPTITSSGPGQFTVTIYVNISDPICGTGGVVVLSVSNINYPGGTYNYTQYTYKDCFGVCSQLIAATITYVYSGTLFSYENVGMYWTDSCTSTAFQSTTEQVNGVLSTPYTAQMAELDMCAALNTIPLNDDLHYPWLPPGYSNTLQGPMAYYDENPQQLAPTNTSITGSTGAIFGKLIVDKVVNFVWNPIAQNWTTCQYQCPDSGPEITEWYNESWGNTSTSDIGIPCATNWLSTYDALFTYDGAYKAMNFVESLPDCNGDTFIIYNDIIWGKKEEKVQLQTGLNAGIKADMTV